jgi:hypothetical protein
MSGLDLRHGETVRVSLEGPDLVRFARGVVVGADHTHVKVRFEEAHPVEIKRRWVLRREFWVHRLNVYPVRGEDVIGLANITQPQALSAADLEYGTRRLRGEPHGIAVERTKAQHPNTGPTRLPEPADPDGSAGDH